MKSVRAVTLLAVFAAAACGDSTEVVMSELSEAEAAELASAIMFATFEGTGDLQPESSAQAAPYQYSESVSGSVECPLGGVVGYAAAVTFEGDTESEAATISYSMTQEHDGCTVATESESIFVLDGAPSLTLDFAVESNGQGVVEWGGSLTGAVRWTSGDRTGTCTAAFEFSGRQEAETSIDAGLSGTLCGHSIEQEFSIG